MTVRIADVVHRIGKPVVTAPQRTSILSLSGLIVRRDLDAVVLVDDELRTVGLVTPRAIVHTLAQDERREWISGYPLSVTESTFQCSLAEDVSVVLRRMLLNESSVLLIEDKAKPVATVTLDRLAEAALLGIHDEVSCLAN